MVPVTFGYGPLLYASFIIDMTIVVDATPFEMSPVSDASPRGGNWVAMPPMTAPCCRCLVHQLSSLALLPGHTNSRRLTNLTSHCKSKLKLVYGNDM